MTQSIEAGLVPEWTVGDRLRKARRVAGFHDASTFADAIGVHRDTVRNYEEGVTQRHSRAVLMQWAMRTGVSLQWLRTGNSPRPGDPDGGSVAVRHQGLEPRTRWYGAQRVADWGVDPAHVEHFLSEDAA